MSKVIVLLSGGLDSAVCLALALSQGHEVQTLTFDYGQRHGWGEIAAAEQVAAHYSVPFERVKVPLEFGRSHLGPSTAEDWEGASPYYVPGRNTVLCSLAAGIAEARGFSSVWVGFNADDAEGFPDCRPDYLRALNEVLRLGTVAVPSIYAPLIYNSKCSIVERARELEAPINLTLSCYEGSNCGGCDSCRLRSEALGEL